MIGDNSSVATLPRYRGQGLTSAILRRIWSDLTDNGAAVALISGRRDLYDRLGAVPEDAFIRASWSPTMRADGNYAVAAGWASRGPFPHRPLSRGTYPLSAQFLAVACTAPLF